MIPAFSLSGLLPPYVGANPTRSVDLSPYPAAATEVVRRFATSAERRAILQGLFDYRRKLRKIGITNGFQWIDGSFVENIEVIRGRPPQDLDVVTFAYRPMNDPDAWGTLFDQNRDLFTPSVLKAQFKCDAYYVDLNMPAHLLVERTRYWNALFSHQRGTSQWKGCGIVAAAVGRRRRVDHSS